ncbi:site-specific integrase [Pontibacter russatus]|uniref:site-specific integrase n=1 Tax=Pontibacter russatus TaxID=2694929 RepID=UPI00137A4747|nr:site-specific integrase [Pontibacter russatus]
MTKVKLRGKPISQGRQTLYLDYYPPISHPETGKLTRREFLSLYIYDKPKASLDKEHNKETKALAENIRAKRQIEVQNGQYGFLHKKKLSTQFIDYYKEEAKKRTGSNSDNWNSSIYYIEEFFNEGLKISELNSNLCNEYRNFILTAPSQRSKEKKPLSRNSAVSYFNKFKATLKQAYKEGYLQSDLNVKVQSIKPEETHREYLTLEELQRLYNTKCELPIMKRAAIFSALTGLRFSDIQKLLWSELQQSNAEGYYIQFRQQKTKGVEVLPIPENAMKLTGERGEPTDLVFKGLEYSASNNNILKDWIKKATINKSITFHCFRHTYATLQLSLGTDIYTVSKLLGHRELKTTQIYAKVVDKAKREAANRIRLEL